MTLNRRTILQTLTRFNTASGMRSHVTPEVLFGDPSSDGVSIPQAV